MLMLHLHCCQRLQCLVLLDYCWQLVLRALLVLVLLL
jgi:hypothetical protein